MGDVPLEPFNDIIAQSTYITSASTNFQLLFGPYANPTGRKLYLRKMIISNSMGTPLALRIWDQDLSGSGTASRGSAASNGCLIELSATQAAATSGTGIVTSYEPSQIPMISFEAGIAVQCTQINALLMWEVGVQ